MMLLRWAVLVLVVGTTLVSGGVALSTNVTGLKTGSNSTITFHQFYLGTQFHSAFHDTDSNNVEPTDISTTLYGHSSGLEREVNVYDYVSGSSAYGWAQCMSSSGTTCWNWYVVMNQAYSYTNAQAESLMCEEIGHSVGLHHRYVDGTCMSQQWDENRFNQHDINHLNAIY